MFHETKQLIEAFTNSDPTIIPPARKTAIVSGLAELKGPDGQSLDTSSNCSGPGRAMKGQDERHGSAWPECDFRKSKLSLTSQKQLAGIYQYVIKEGVVPKDKAGFINKVLARHVYDQEKWIYVPLSNTVKLIGKLPVFAKIPKILPIACPETPSWTPFFGNPLTIPAGYEEIDFIAEDAAAPILRLTNAGFLVVTAELDPNTLEEFEETLSWTRGKDDDFRQSLFARIDTRLCEFNDYRGYCVVFSGRRSLHFHFVFDTKHLRNCPWDATARERHDAPQCALMAKVHERYWDCVTAIFSETVGRSLPFDRRLRQATQWRRMPWAIRTLEKDAEILDLPEGARVPQIVIHENIRSRASSKATTVCVHAMFSVSVPDVAVRKTTARLPATEFNLDQTLKELQEVCEVEWGPFPCPVSIEQQNGEWLFKFKNSEVDENPSTIALGGYRKLQINGKHDFTQEFYFPDNMTAQEWGDYLCAKVGRAGLSVTNGDGDAKSGEQSNAAASGFAAYKARMKKKQPLIVKFLEDFSHSFPGPIAGGPEEAMKAYRAKLAPTLVQARGLASSTIIKSGEGIGKTTEIAGILAAEAFDSALQKVGRNDGRSQEFIAFAFRSRQQAQTRAKEFRRMGLSAVAVLTFWEHLRIACEELHVTYMEKESFEQMSLPDSR